MAKFEVTLVQMPLIQEKLNYILEDRIIRWIFEKFCETGLIAQRYHSARQKYFHKISFMKVNRLNLNWPKYLLQLI